MTFDAQFKICDRLFKESIHTSQSQDQRGRKEEEPVKEVLKCLSLVTLV